VQSNIVSIAGRSPTSVFGVSTPSALGENFLSNGSTVSRLYAGSEDSKDVAIWQTGFVEVGSNPTLNPSNRLTEIAAHTAPFGLSAPTALIPAPPVSSVSAFFAIGEHDAVLYNASTAWRGDPTTNTFTASPPLNVPASSTLLAWGGPTDVWFNAGNGVAKHFDGVAVTSVVVSAGATALELSANNGQAWARNGTAIVHLDAGVFVSEAPLPATPTSLGALSAGPAGDAWFVDPTFVSHQTFAHLTPGGAWTTLTDGTPGRISTALLPEANRLLVLATSGRLAIDTAITPVPAMGAPNLGNLFQGAQTSTWAWAVASRGPTIMNEYLMRQVCGVDRWDQVPPMASSYDSKFSVAPDGAVLRSAQDARGGGRNLLRYAGPR